MKQEDKIKALRDAVEEANAPETAEETPVEDAE